MILVREKTVEAAYREAFNKLYCKKNAQSFDSQLWREDSAVITITEVDGNKLKMTLKDDLLSSKINWKKLFPSASSRLINEEIEYWNEELVKSQKLRKIINFMGKHLESRRLVLNFWRDQYRSINATKCSCITHIYMRVKKNGILEMHSHVRANNASFLLYMDMKVLSQIQKIIADKLGLKPGIYVHFIDSMHFYNRELKSVEAQKKIMEKSLLWR